MSTSGLSSVKCIEVVDWPGNLGDAMVHCFDRRGGKIACGANLLVGHGQVAAMVSRGRLADVFAPGTHVLDPQTLPFLFTLEGRNEDNREPFEADIYFVSTLNLAPRQWKFQTLTYGMKATRGQTAGSFEARVRDPLQLLRISTNQRRFVSSQEIYNRMIERIEFSLCELLQNAGTYLNQWAADSEKLRRLLAPKVRIDFSTLGIELLNLTVDNFIFSTDPSNNPFPESHRIELMAISQNAHNEENTVECQKLFPNPIGLHSTQQLLDESPDVNPVYFLAIDGVKMGPYDLNTLHTQGMGGIFTPQTLIWRRGLAFWQKAHHLPELAVIFGNK